MRVKRDGRSRRPIGAVVVGVLVVGLAIAGGAELSKSVGSSLHGGEDPIEARPTTVPVTTAGRLQVAPDPSWKRLAAAPSVPGFDGRRTIAYAPHPGLSTVVLATVTPADDRTLLPAGLRDQAPRPVSGRLAGLRAWYYRGMKAERWRLDAAVLPTSNGVVTLACAVPGTAGEVPLGCLDDVRRVGVQGAETLTPNAGLAFELRLPGVMSRLDDARVAARTALRRGKTPRAQARAAADLQRRHEKAATVLAPVAGDAGAAAAIVTALRRTAAAYGGLEHAAVSRDRRAWKRASRLVHRRELALRRALAAQRPVQS